jgi:16S rRNA (uracil1498-N3)-methyltransferase
MTADENENARTALSPVGLRVPVSPLVEGPLRLSPAQSKYVHRVHRKGIGERLLLVDHTNAREARATIVSVDANGGDEPPGVGLVEVLVEAPRAALRPSSLTHTVIVVQALGKADKIDEIARDLTEIGAARLVPITTRRTVVKLAGKEEARLERWRRVVVEAARQACRADLLAIDPVMPFARALHAVEADVRLVFAPSGTVRLSDLVLPPHSTIAVLIGPEGGLAPEEITAAEAAGWQTMTTGPTVLRTETAGPAVAAALLYR